MLDAIFGALGFDWRALAALIVAGAVALGAVFLKGRQSGKGARARDVLNRVQDGQSAVGKGRASGDTPDERVRRNDGAWK